jgi:hypothetical protein
LLTSWPRLNEFIVPVELDDPNDQFTWALFVDYDASGGGPTLQDMRMRAPSPADPSALDGGVTLLTIVFNPDDLGIDRTRCHNIEVRVAHDFLRNSTTGAPLYHTFDSIGGDSIVWNYVPGSTGCREFDVDSGSPPADASEEILPITPQTEAGGDP